MSPSLAIVGGGITGLTAAAEAARRDPELHVSVLEADGNFGGKIVTEDVDGIAVDTGPDSFLAREPWAVELCRAVGLGDELVAPAVFGAYVWTKGRLRRLPEGFAFGMPSRPTAALRSGILSPAGALRAAADLMLPGPLAGGDVSVGAFVRKRFGPEVLDRLVDPLLAGTRAGRPDELSLAVAAPQIDRLARAHRSLILGLRAARRAGALEQGAPPFVTVRGGLTRLVAALVEHLRERVDLRPMHQVERIDASDDGYRLDVVGAGVTGADRIVLTVAPYVATTMLQHLVPEAAELLEAIPYASAATVTLVYPPDSYDVPADGSGFLVPSTEGKTLAAATWYSTKWAGATQDGRQVAKCFVGRAAGDPGAELPQEELVERVTSEFNDAMGTDARPQATHVTRWRRALPQYHVGHVELLADIDAAMAGHPGIVLAGSGQGGSGIPDCIQRATEAITWVMASLR